MSVGKVLEREARVAFSRRAQPVWFRVLKWVILIGVSVTLWRTPATSGCGYLVVSVSA